MRFLSMPRMFFWMSVRYQRRVILTAVLPSMFDAPMRLQGKWTMHSCYTVYVCSHLMSHSTIIHDWPPRPDGE